MATQFLLADDEVKVYPRQCSECGKGMFTGYCINGGETYYCSDKCLHKNYTHEEYIEMYHKGNGDSYYTEWSEADIETD